MNHQIKKITTLDYLLVTIVSILFGVILFLLLFLFKKVPFTNKQTPTSSPSYKNQPSITSSITLPSKTYTNTTTQWKSEKISNSEYKVLSSVEIVANISPEFEKNAPGNTSSGISFSNDLEEKDPNCRKISLYYYLKNHQWILKFQAGKSIQYTGLSLTTKEHMAGTYSLLIASNGKSALVTLPNKSKKTIYFSTSLYDITNQFVLKSLIGPKSKLTILSLTYKVLN